MTTSETELQERVYNYFSELQVFENENINNSLDEIYSMLKKNFGKLGEEIKICGSVAKIFDGKLPENYNPKDIDVVVFSPYFWRFLQANITKISAEEITKMDYRFILRFSDHLIEIWKPMHPHQFSGVFKNKINYCYAN